MPWCCCCLLLLFLMFMFSAVHHQCTVDLQATVGHHTCILPLTSIHSSSSSSLSSPGSTPSPERRSESLSLSLSFCPSVSLSLCFSLCLSLSFTHTHTHSSTCLVRTFCPHYWSTLILTAFPTSTVCVFVCTGVCVCMCLLPGGTCTCNGSGMPCVAALRPEELPPLDHK